ncbi:hypothetical protein [Novosphingobium sp.]|uniref:hypothetical protein n=1 Tax=Novosphingobium sp. TaxID=1874826 RepID=UPI00260B3744|nr:hypothetical protein [Novosphingobium sp.]
MTVLPAEGIILVKALQARRFRAGLEFGRELRELAVADLGEGLEGLSKLVMLAEDPLLAVTVVFGDEARPIGPDELGELRAVIEAEKLRVDPANPPEPVADLITIPGGGTTQAAGLDAAGPLFGEASPPPVLAAEPQSASMGNDTPSDAPASDAGPTIADNPASESQPAGEQTGSPAAEAKPRTNTRREKAKA